MQKFFEISGFELLEVDSEFEKDKEWQSKRKTEMRWKISELKQQNPDSIEWKNESKRNE